MNRTKTISGLALVALLLVLGTAACVVRTEGPPPAAIIVQRPPPAEIVEQMPPPPGPAEVWVWQRGHWRWDGHDYHWNPGHWVQRPANVHAWQAPHWEQHPSGGWIFIEGRWQ